MATKDPYLSKIAGSARYDAGQDFITNPDTGDSYNIGNVFRMLDVNAYGPSAENSANAMAFQNYLKGTVLEHADEGKVYDAQRKNADALLISAYTGRDVKDVLDNYDQYFKFFSGNNPGKGVFGAFKDHFEGYHTQKQITNMELALLDIPYGDPRREYYEKQLEELKVNHAVVTADVGNNSEFWKKVASSGNITAQTVEQIGRTFLASAVFGALGGAMAPQLGIGMDNLVKANSVYRSMKTGQAANMLAYTIVNMGKSEAAEIADKAMNMVDDEGNRIPLEVIKQFAYPFGVISAITEILDESITPLGEFKLGEKTFNETAEYIIKMIKKNPIGYVGLGAGKTVFESVQEGVQSLIRNKGLNLIIGKSNQMGYTKLPAEGESEDSISSWEEALNEFRETIIPMGANQILTGGLSIGASFTTASLSRAMNITPKMRQDAKKFFNDNGKVYDIGYVDTVGQQAVNIYEPKKTEDGKQSEQKKAAPIYMYVNKTTGALVPIYTKDRQYVEYLRENGVTGIKGIVINEGALENIGNVASASRLSSLLSMSIGEQAPVMGYDGSTVIMETQEGVESAIEEIQRQKKAFSANEDAVEILKQDDGSYKIVWENSRGNNQIVTVRAKNENDQMYAQATEESEAVGNVHPAKAYKGDGFGNIFDSSIRKSKDQTLEDAEIKSAAKYFYQQLTGVDDKQFEEMWENDYQSLTEKLPEGVDENVIEQGARFMPLLSAVTGRSTEDLLNDAETPIVLRYAGKAQKATYADGTEGYIRGGFRVEYNKDSKRNEYVINLTDMASIKGGDTLVHELMHIARRMASKERLEGFRKAYGQNDLWYEDVKEVNGKFVFNGKEYETKAQAEKQGASVWEEKFVQDFFRYLKTGEAPNAEVASFFGQLKRFLQSFVNDYSKELSPELKNAFDKLLNGELDIQPGQSIDEAVEASERTLTDEPDVQESAVETESEEDYSEDQMDNGLDEDGNPLWSLAPEEIVEKFKTEPITKAYRTMQLIDGELYPPKATYEKGKKGPKLLSGAHVGDVLMSEERPEMAYLKTLKDGTTKYVFDLHDGVGTTGGVDYNPYFHSSGSIFNDQFTGAINRPNQVLVEVSLLNSDLDSGYQAEKANKPVGETKWHYGSLSKKLKDAKKGERTVYLSRYVKIERIVPTEEVASMMKEGLEGTGIKIDVRTVTPSLRAELEKQGVALDYSKVKGNDLFSLTNDNQWQVMDANTQRRIDADYERTYNQYFGTDQWMKAPNGKPTNLTERQWVQVRTPAFKEWFGDWENDPENASKAVDENGEPKVFLHGSVEQFDTFDKAKIKANETDAPFNGFWFTDKELIASPAFRTRQYLSEVFLNVRNPAEYEKRGIYKLDREITRELWDEETGNWNQQSRSVQDEMRYRLQAEGYDGVWFATRPDLSSQEGQKLVKWTTARGKKLSLHLNDDGYYYLYEGWNEDSDAFVTGGWKTTAEYANQIEENTLVVFEPNQIKSATDNNGAFSRDNDSILFSIAPPVESTEFKNWFDGSKVVDEQSNPLVVYHGSSVRGLDEFSPRNSVNGGEGLIYATKDRNVATEYSQRYNQLSAFTRVPTGEFGEVYPVYMSLKNPLDLRNLTEHDKQVLLDAYKQTWKVEDAEKTFNEVLEAKNYEYLKAMADRVIRNLSEYGYDGLITPTEYAAVRPEQVKQVPSENVLYSLQNNDSILYSLADQDGNIPITADVERMYEKAKERIPSDSPWSSTLFSLEAVTANVKTTYANTANVTYQVSMQEGELEKFLQKNWKEADLQIKSLEQARQINTNPERIKDWQTIYKAAMERQIIDKKTGEQRAIQWGDWKKKASSGKVFKVPCIDLSIGCQRIRTVIERVANGIMPHDTVLESCYGGDCFVNNDMGHMFDPEGKKEGGALKGKNVDTQDLGMATPTDIDNWFADPKFRKFLQSSMGFIRMGFIGDCSHSFPILDGYNESLAEAWLRNIVKYDIKNPVSGKYMRTIFITAGYAPVTQESYERLVPYKDLFVVHVSTSGWFTKNENLLRLAEFDAMNKLGLKVMIRNITDKNGISKSKFNNSEWLKDYVFNTMKMRQNQILATAFHDDKSRKHSDMDTDYKYQCCVTGQCVNCKVGCGSRIDLDAPEGTTFQIDDDYIGKEVEATIRYIRESDIKNKDNEDYTVTLNREGKMVSTLPASPGTSTTPQIQPQDIKNGNLVVDRSQSEVEEYNAAVEEFSKKNNLPDSELYSLDGVLYTRSDPSFDYSEENLRSVKDGISRQLELFDEKNPQLSLPFDTGLSGNNNRGPARVLRQGLSKFFSFEKGWNGKEPAIPSINQQWNNFGYIDFTKIRINGASDIAKLWSIYRNPKVEYQHVIFTKGDEIVGSLALSSGLVGSAPAILAKDIKESHVKMKERMSNYGADGFWLLHNHPSGNVTPSPADRNVTEHYKMGVPGFKGHIILDHNKFALLKSAFDDEVFTLPESGFHDIDETIPSNAVRFQKAWPQEIAAAFSRLRKTGTNIVYIGWQGDDLYIAPEAILKYKKGYHYNYLDIIDNQQAREATYAVIVTDSWNKFENVVRECNRSKVTAVDDVIIVGASGVYYSAFEGGELVPKLKPNGNKYNFQEVMSSYDTVAREDVRYNPVMETGDNTLFSLSPERQAEILQARKNEIQRAVEAGIFVSTEYLNEFRGEPWADKELELRDWMAENPDVVQIARLSNSVKQFKENYAKSQGDPDWDIPFDEEDLDKSEEELDTEDEWYRTIYQYAHAFSTEDRDRMFAVEWTASEDKTLELAKLLRGYMDAEWKSKPKSGSGGYWYTKYKYNAFKGVSQKVRQLQDGNSKNVTKKRSSSEEIQEAQKLIRENPRPYRNAYMLAMQGESRAADVLAGMSNIGESADWMKLEAIDDDIAQEIERLDQEQEAKRRPKTDYKATQQSIQQKKDDAEQDLRKAGIEPDKADKEKLEKDLADANQKIKDLNEEIKGAEAEVDDIIERMGAKIEDLKEKADKADYLKAQLKDRRARVDELRGKLTEANADKRRLSNALDALRRWKEAKLASDYRTKRIRQIKRFANFNPASIDAAYAQALFWVSSLFDMTDEVREERKSLTDQIAELREQISAAKQADQDTTALNQKLLYLRGQKKQSRMLTPPEQLAMYLPQEYLVRADNRPSAWTAEELDTLLEALKQMRHDGREMLENKQRARANKLLSMGYQYFIDRVGRMPDLTEEGFMSARVLQKDIADSLKEAGETGPVKSFILSYAKLQRLARILDGDREGVLYDWFVRENYKHQSEELSQIARRMDAAQKEWERLGFSGKELTKEGFKGVKGNGTEYSLTRGQMIGVYVYSLNEIGKEKLMHYNGNNISDADINTIISQLTDAEKAWGDYMLSDFEDNWQRLADVYYRGWNMLLGKRDNYFTFVPSDAATEAQLENGIDPQGDIVGKDGKVYTNKSFTKQINPNAVYPLELDVTRSWNWQVRKQEHFIAYGEWAKDSQYLFDQSQIINLAERTIGKAEAANFKKIVNSVIGGQGSDNDFDKAYTKWLAKRNSAVLIGNVGTILKQGPSWFAAFNGDVAVSKVLQSAVAANSTLRAFLTEHPQVAAMFDNDVDTATKFIWANAPEMKNRQIDMDIMEQLSRMDGNTFANLFNPANRVISKYTMGLVDKLVVNNLWMAKYYTEFEAQKKAGKSEQKAHEEAAFKASQLISETQPTSMRMDQSAKQIDAKTSSFLRGIMVFTNQVVNTFNQLYIDVPMAFRQKNWKKVASKLGSTMVMLATVGLLSGKFWKRGDEDDKKYRWRVAREILSTMAQVSAPGFGSIVSTVLDYGEYNTYVFGLDTIASSARSLLTPSKTTSGWEKLADVLIDLAIEAGYAVGAPVTPIRNIIKSVEKGETGYLLGGTWGKIIESNR